MSNGLLLTLGAVFLSVALLAGTVAALVMSRPAAASRRRLSNLVQPRTTVLAGKDAALTDAPTPFWDRLANALPSSFGSIQRLRREMVLAGYHSARAAALFSVAELLSPVLLALLPIFLLTTPLNRWVAAGFGGVVGYMLPSLLLRRRINRRKKEIQNGLADALDLLVLCLEAGSSLDQALVKASDELEVAYPALGDQLHVLTSEMRAGKARLDAFRGLAARTQVDDVRALVTMLVQTDRFGTSIAQALRTFAEVCRTKRRQRAEERAQKVGVKLVFPLVFCLFPALYVVMLGPAFIQFVRVFGETGVK